MNYTIIEKDNLKDKKDNSDSLIEKEMNKIIWDQKAPNRKVMPTYAK